MIPSANHPHSKFILPLLGSLLMSFFPIIFLQMGKSISALESIALLMLSSTVLNFALLILQKPDLSIPSIPDTSNIPSIPKARLQVSKKVVLLAVAIALFSLAGNWSYFMAINMIDPAIAITLQRSELIFVALLGAYFFAERINSNILIAIVLSLIGVTVLQLPLDDQLDIQLDIDQTTQIMAIILCLFSAFAFAAMLALSKYAIKYVSPQKINLYRLIVLTLILLLFEENRQILIMASSTLWILALLAAICGPFGARLIFTHALKYLPMTKLLLITMVSPIFTSIWQYYFFGIVLNLNEVIGACLILSGISWMIYRR